VVASTEKSPEKCILGGIYPSICSREFQVVLGDENIGKGNVSSNSPRAYQEITAYDKICVLVFPKNDTDVLWHYKINTI